MPSNSSWLDISTSRQIIFACSIKKSSRICKMHGVVGSGLLYKHYPSRVFGKVHVTSCLSCFYFRIQYLVIFTYQIGLTMYERLG